MRITLVEDNKMLAQAVAAVLRADGHSIAAFDNGADADEHLKHAGTDLVILDINLPGLNGIAVLEHMRARGDSAPVLMLTARANTSDRVAGLDAGADDYLVKPFEMEELKARIRALIRRRGRDIATVETFGPLRFDRAARQVFVEGKDLGLSRRELAVLECLIDRRGRIVPKSTIFDHVYGVDATVEDHTVEVHISRLRKRLEVVGVKVKVARGLGYILDPSCA